MFQMGEGWVLRQGLGLTKAQEAWMPDLLPFLPRTPGRWGQHAGPGASGYTLRGSCGRHHSVPRLCPGSWRDRRAGPLLPASVQVSLLPLAAPSLLPVGASCSPASTLSPDCRWEGSSHRRKTQQPALRREEGLAQRLGSAWASPSTCSAHWGTGCAAS